MKKTLALLLCFAALSLTLAACTDSNTSGSQSTGQTSSQTDSSSDTAGTPDLSGLQPAAGYAFTSGTAEVKMAENMANLLPALGEPKNIFEAPSCAFDGVDKIFYYNGFQINTFPVNGEDFVLSVTFADDSVTTTEGAYLGMTAEEVKAKQGEPAEEIDGALSYVDGDTELVFLLEDGTVTDISYYLLSQKDSLLQG